MKNKKITNYFSMLGLLVVFFTTQNFLIAGGFISKQSSEKGTKGQILLQKIIIEDMPPEINYEKDEIHVKFSEAINFPATTTIEIKENLIISSLENEFGKITSELVINSVTSEKDNILEFAYSENIRNIALCLKNYRYHFFKNCLCAVDIYAEPKYNHIFLFDLFEQKLLWLGTAPQSLKKLIVDNYGNLSCKLATNEKDL